MKSKVMVVADATTGAVINQSVNNPEYGFIRIEQFVNHYDDNGFLRRRKLSALISGPLSDLQDADYYAGMELSGRIIVQESLTPWNEKNPNRELKVAGSTGIVCRIEGQPIYRRTLYTEKENLTDIFLAHDNVDELRHAYTAQVTKVNTLQPNEEFTID
jgi:hypothetical protein